MLQHTYRSIPFGVLCPDPGTSGDVYFGRILRSALRPPIIVQVGFHLLESIL